MLIPFLIGLAFLIAVLPVYRLFKHPGNRVRAGKARVARVNRCRWCGATFPGAAERREHEQFVHWYDGDLLARCGGCGGEGLIPGAFEESQVPCPWCHPESRHQS